MIFYCLFTICHSAEIYIHSLRGPKSIHVVQILRGLIENVEKNICNDIYFLALVVWILWLIYLKDFYDKTHFLADPKIPVTA